uniref:F-box protein GID2 n=1 Tax=Davidia involucrata TaxID=16924 RepID=A0A5B7BTV6_DAVIN
MTKRALNSVDVPVTAGEEAKRRKVEERTGFVNLDDEDMLFEVLKHADARTLATAACVSKQWRRTAEDELLWEMICTRHWANIGCDSQQLRSVVLALGGFRRLHALCLWPLLKTPSSMTTSSSSSHSSLSPQLPPVVSSKRTKPSWGKDEVNLSLSLLSIQYYEKMNFSNRGRSSSN